MTVVNMLVFAAGRAVVPALVASLLGIGMAAIGNVVLGDRLLFRGRTPELTQRMARTRNGRAKGTAETAA